MSNSRQRRAAKRKRRIQYRLRDREWAAQEEPMLGASNVHYDVADRTRAMGYGGIGAIHLMCRRTRLIEAIDQRLHVLKVHPPYSESDHVLNMAFNLQRPMGLSATGRLAGEQSSSQPSRCCVWVKAVSPRRRILRKPASRQR